jgi:hypothetical protein
MNDNSQQAVENTCLIAYRECLNLMLKGDNAEHGVAVVHWENAARRLDVLYDHGRQDLIRRNSRGLVEGY